MANEARVASILHVGLDVHKDSIDIATADAGREGEIRHIGQIGGDLVALDKSLRRLISRGHRLHVVDATPDEGSSLTNNIDFEQTLGDPCVKLCLM